MTKVVVIGGGLAGLAATYELIKRGADVTLLESRPRLGGVCVTDRVDGYVIEGGPDSFLMTKAGAIDLCRELGLENEIVPSLGRRVYVASRGELHPLPEGMFLTVPTRIGPFMKSRLFSWRAKFRMGLDLVLPRGSDAGDESLGSFVRRRLGREAFEKIAEPLMAGIYMADGDELSLQSTFPRFRDLEREHRSLIRALRKAPPGAPVSPFASLRGGMGTLVEKLAASLGDAKVRTGVAVRQIDAGFKVHVDGDTIAADRVIVAVPPPQAADLIANLDLELAEAVRAIHCVGSLTMSLAFPRAAVAHALDGTGFVIPKAERRTMLACTWSSAKFAGRAPDDRVLIRAFLTEEHLRRDDAALVTDVMAELRDRMGITQDPLFTRTFRWPGANPVYRVGHLARVHEIDERLRRVPGVQITGSGYRGIGLPDVIREARATARRALAIA